MNPSYPMKTTVPADWLLSKDHLEEGLEIGAGSLRRLPVNTQARASREPSNIIDITQHVTFGRFVALMRRQKNWSVQALASAADVPTEELLVIEHDPHHEPELSTVHELAKVFKVPSKSLIKMAGLAEEPSSRLREEYVRFAACSESHEPLTHDEETALQAILKVIVEDTDNK